MSDRVARRDLAGRMADAAAALIDTLDAGQREAAVWPFPSDDERLLWFYTPTDHGGVTLADLAHRSSASPSSSSPPGCRVPAT